MTTEQLVPVDVEGAVCAILEDALGVPVATRVPNPRPDGESYVRVTRTGGTGRDLTLSDATVLIECWAPDSVAAFGLARDAYGRMWQLNVGMFEALPGGVRIGGVSLSEPVNFPDPDTTSPRYQFIATLITVLQRVGPMIPPPPPAAVGYGLGVYGRGVYGIGGGEAPSPPTDSTIYGTGGYGLGVYGV